MNVDQELDALLTVDVTDAEVLSADALLAELEGSTLPEISVDEVEASTETIVEPEEHQVTLSEKELGISKSDLYEAQDSKVGVAAEEDAEPVEGSTGVAAEEDAEPVEGSTAPTTPTRKRKASATPGADENATTRSGLLKRKADITGLANIGYDGYEVEQIMAAIDEAPKKVGEKASNLLRYGLGRDHVSNFTRFALNKLVAAEDMSMTVPELVKAMQDERNYSVGTARSQSQQMSRLFGIFGMVSKDGSKMTLDKDNRLTAAILKRLDGEPGWARGETTEAEVEAEATPESGEIETLVAETEVEAPETHAEKAKKRRGKKKGATQDAELLAA